MSDWSGWVYAEGATAESEGRRPAVPVGQSVTPDEVVCLFDGVRLQNLRRRILETYGITPEQYRDYWGLPADHPLETESHRKAKAAAAKAAMARR